MYCDFGVTRNTTNINPLTAGHGHLKLCLADAFHSLKWVKIIQILRNGGQLFSNFADWCNVLLLKCLKSDIWSDEKKKNVTGG